MISCIVLSHGQVAQAIVDASEEIVGECSNLYAVHCDGLSPKALYEKLTHLIESEKLKDGLFILVCLRGGSCWNVAVKVVQKWPKVEVISGLNLSIVLSFITKRNQYSFDELSEVLVKDAIRGVSRVNLK